MKIGLAGYPKSGNHYLRALLERSGHTVVHTHDVRALADPDWPGPPALRVAVIRDVRDVIVSGICHWIILGPELDPEQLAPHAMRMAHMVRDGHSGFAPYTEWMRAMGEAPRVYVLRYEDLVADPVGAAARYLGVDVTEGARAVAWQLEQRSPEELWERLKFRRGRPGQWAQVFTPAEQKTLWDWFGNVLAFWGYRPAGGPPRELEDWPGPGPCAGDPRDS